MSDSRTWWPEGYGEHPAFEVRRQVYGTVTGGDYTRGSSVLTLAKTALRYPTTTPGTAEALDRAILHVRVASHYIRKEPMLSDSGVVEQVFERPVGDIEVTWGWPSSVASTWEEMALVRSAFGRPSTVNDGVTVLNKTRDFFESTTDLDEEGNPALLTPPILTDIGLPTGRWYHYGLFFRVNEVDWIQGMLDSTLLPRDFHHADHLYNNVPPYYRWVDENGLVGDGYLKQFLSVFGFELDQWREFIESWQHVYDVDWSPIRLLRRLGSNFGYEYEQGVGDIRYRSLFSDLGRFYEIRGTEKCLSGVVNRFSKYRCDVTGGSNVMLLPDDSDFSRSAGNWGVVLDSTDAPGSGYLSKDKVSIAPTDPTWIVPPPGIGRGVLSVYTLAADATADIGIACGDSYIQVDANGVPYAGSGIWKEITPTYGGIPIDPLMSYGFSVYIRSQLLPTAVQVALLFFDGSNNLVSTSTGPVTSVSTVNTWQQFSVGTVVVPPVGAVYVCPYILFDTRSTSGAFPVTSPSLFLAGAMVYTTPTIGEALGPPPNRYLTISDPGEPLGAGLQFKGTLSGAATPLPTTHATLDAYAVGTPVPTAIPQFLGVTPARAAAAGDAVYWNGVAWINIGPIPSTWLPYLLGQPTSGGT